MILEPQTRVTLHTEAEYELEGETDTVNAEHNSSFQCNAILHLPFAWLVGWLVGLLLRSA